MNDQAPLFDVPEPEEHHCLLTHHIEQRPASTCLACVVIRRQLKGPA